MPNEVVTLVVTPVQQDAGGALAAYFAADAEKSRKRLPGPLADEAVTQFQASLRNLTERCDRFLTATDQRQQSHLVLGKVQSGKTAHLLGMLAWATDSIARAAVVFTGVTGSLNDQTYERIASDLATLTGNPIEVLYVPTRSNKRAFQELKDRLLQLANARGGIAGSGEPLPVLVSMKNPTRVGATKAAFSLLSEKFGSESVIVAIDDESDQASQNAKSRQRRVAATYLALAGIRALPLRNLWLSYTATPQAVLLTDRLGELRPDFVSTVAPRRGYFGLESAMSPSFESQLVEVWDWRQPARVMASCPESLTEAICRFLFTAWIRVHAPCDFYCDAFGEVDISSRLRSTQMLIHESGMQADHGRMYRLVLDEIGRIRSTAIDGLAGTAPSDDVADFVRRFTEVANAISHSGAVAKDYLPTFLASDGQIEFVQLLDDLKVAVINSDPAGPTAEDPRPVSDQNYEQHAAWILIGGDILGRGITIPQLTVNYFLRSSRTPNFDTVLQQLRFCGYRWEYRKWLCIYAPQQSIDDLRYMEIVDRAVWERASTWDREERHIGQSMPSVFYASPTGARFEPTRTSVRDPDIVDRKIRGDCLFALKDIFDPGDFRKNLTHARRWIQESALAPNETSDSWMRFDDLPAALLRQLLVGWHGSNYERGMVEAVAEVLDPELGNLGLSQVPSVVYISRLLPDLWVDPSTLEERIADVSVTRSTSSPAAGPSLRSWFDHYESFRHHQPGLRPILRVPHIGGGQRALRNHLGYNAVVFIIEPILGVTQSRDRSSAVAVGLGFAALSPDNYEIRTIGHS